MFRAAITLTLALGLAAPAWATRVLEQLETPYELTLTQVNLPTVVGGTLSFRACDSCRVVAHSISASTRFFVGSSEVAFVDFNAAVDQIRKTAAPGKPVLVGVFVDIQSQQVNRIVVQPPKG